MTAIEGNLTVQIGTVAINRPVQGKFLLRCCLCVFK